jgi:hypothetical protein
MKKLAVVEMNHQYFGSDSLAFSPLQIEVSILLEAEHFETNSMVY